MGCDQSADSMKGDPSKLPPMIPTDENGVPLPPPPPPWQDNPDYFKELEEQEKQRANQQ